MSGINKLAVFREFPFLSQCCDITRLQEACVKRFDKEVLSIPIRCHSGKVYLYRKILLLDKTGCILIKLGGDQLKCEIHSPFSLLKSSTWWGPRALNVNFQECTTSDAFALLQSRIEDVHYAIDIHKGELTLYKPPKGFASIGSWIISQGEELTA